LEKTAGKEAFYIGKKIGIIERMKEEKLIRKFG